MVSCVNMSDVKMDINGRMMWCHLFLLSEHMQSEIEVCDSAEDLQTCSRSVHTLALDKDKIHVCLVHWKLESMLSIIAIFLRSP